VALPRPKQLVVEDNDQKGAVIGLMRHHGIPWPREEEAGWPIYIDVGNSAEEVLKKSSLSARLKTSGLSTLGIMLDADDVFDSRWATIRAFCVENFTSVPSNFPADGLVLSEGGKRFGAWVMPDNRSGGMIETFCRALVPSHMENLWEHAVTSASQAKSKGAPFHDVHTEKAHMYAWLAWQHPPGERMGTAISKKLLNPISPTALPFVAWFKRLYEL
jgi:Protein of unknown function (DUF3226)